MKLDYSTDDAVRATSAAIGERVGQLLEIADTEGAVVIDQVGGAAMILLAALVLEAHGMDLGEVAKLIPIITKLVDPNTKTQITALIQSVEE